MRSHSKLLLSLYLVFCCTFCFSGCYTFDFKYTPKDTPISWTENDLLYQKIYYGKHDIKSFTINTAEIDEVGEKLFFKFKHSKGCVDHSYEILIPSLALKSGNSSLPWIINHEHPFSNCDVHVITEYTLDLTSIPISNDWRTSPPKIINPSEGKQVEAQITEVTSTEEE